MVLLEIMKNVSLQKEYHWLEVDYLGNISEHIQAGYFDGGYFYLNKSGIVDKNDALRRLEEYYVAARIRLVSNSCTYAMGTRSSSSTRTLMMSPSLRLSVLVITVLC